MKRWLRVSGVAAAAFGLVVVLAACDAGEREREDTSENAIIGGADAPSPSLNAVGALGQQFQGQTHAFCTAALIAPTVVLTAKHCALENAQDPASPTMLDSGPVYFLVGPDSHAPLRVVRAKAITSSAIFQGGFTGLGSDVA